MKTFITYQNQEVEVDFQRYSGGSIVVGDVKLLLNASDKIEIAQIIYDEEREERADWKYDCARDMELEQRDDNT